MAVLKPYDGTDYHLWKYLPSEAASIIFIVLFLAITALHFWRIYKLRSWFCLAFAVGCLCKFPPPYSLANPSQIQNSDSKPPT